MKKKLLNVAIAMALGSYGGYSYADQQVDTSVKTLNGTDIAIDFQYTASKTELTGLGLTFYFDSSKFKWKSFSDVLTKDKTGQDAAPSADTANGDGDATTDSKLTIAWTSLSGNWPGQLPVKLFTSNFSFADGYTPAVGDKTVIRLTAQTAAGHAFVASELEINIPDQDGDGVPDFRDNCPAVKNSDQLNTDENLPNGDQQGDACDTDDDADGVPDQSDDFPLDTTETIDTDNDGIGNNADTDDDGDGISDVDEEKYGLNRLDAADALEDKDNDGFSNLAEISGGTNPTDANSQPDAQIVQVQESKGKASLGRVFPLSVFYNNNTNDTTLSGLGAKIHYDSSKLQLKVPTPTDEDPNPNGLINILKTDFIAKDAAPIPDSADLDNIPETDQYITVAWTSIGGEWPNQTLPLKLYDALFVLREDANLEVGDTTTIGFSSSATANGYAFLGKPYTITVAPPFTFDVDGTGEAKALTDGLLVIRYLFGFSGDTLIRGAVGNDAERTTSTEIEDQLKIGVESGILDIDGDGKVEPLTDGLLILRYLFGFTGDTLIKDAVSSDGTRTTAADIQAHIKEYFPE